MDKLIIALMLLVLPYVIYLGFLMVGSFVAWSLILPNLFAFRFLLLGGIALSAAFYMTTDENGVIVEDESETNES